MGAEGRAAWLLRQWAIQARLSVLLVTRSPSLFVTYAISDFVTALAGVAGVFLLAERFGGIGDWTKAEIVFMLGWASLALSTCDTLFGYNVLAISRRIGRGQLDHVLIQPRPMWMTLLTEGFSPLEGVTPLLPGVALLWWSSSRVDVSFDFVWLVLAILAFAGSCAIVVAFAYLWGTLAFWAPRGAEEVSASTHAFTWTLRSFPLDGASALLKASMLSVLPVGFVAWFPARALLHEDLAAAAVTPAAAALLSSLAAAFFRKGVSHYARTGSQRYSDWGHRG